MSELLLFGACLALGAIARTLYRLVTMLEKRTKILAVTIILDFLLVAIVAICYTAILFFMSNGQILSYTLAALALGFLIISIFF